MSDPKLCPTCQKSFRSESTLVEVYEAVVVRAVNAEAEVKRLREALEQIHTYRCHEREWSTTTVRTVDLHPLDGILNKALEPKDDN